MLRREAASWLARLQSGRDPDIVRKFERWRSADTRHADAFSRVSQSYEQAGLLRQSAAVTSERHESSVPKARWPARPALAAAAAALALVPIGALFLRGSGAPFGARNTVMLMTAVGEIREVRLADGSKVTLDTSTKVDVEIGRSHRSARLRYGRARFHIAPANASFVVETESTSITTPQAIIDVEQGGRQDRVEVLSGAADVRRLEQGKAGNVRLAAGQGLIIDSVGARRVGAMAQAPDWTNGMLQFDGTPLAEAVALANRYSERHIVLTGDLHALRVSGAFRASDTLGLAKALAAAFGLALEQHPDGRLILSPGASSSRQNKNGG